MNDGRAERLTKLPKYLFVEIDRKKDQAIADGRDVIDFGVGDPDGPTPDFIIDRMAAAIRDPANHQYSSSRGMPELRKAFADFFQRRYAVTLDPDAQVLVLLGAKEGIAHLGTAVLDPGDIALIPQPGYPVYASGAIFADAHCHTMPLRPDNDWLPKLEEIPPAIRQTASLMWLNYPNNPTAAVAPRSFFDQAVAVAKEHDILIAQDAAYNELFFDDPPPSILEVSGAGDVAIEFHSLSKTFNMTGWRIGFAVGQPQALAALADVKSNIDSGAFAAVQHAGITALDGFERAEVRGQRGIYRARRDILVEGLRNAGWSVDPPAATIYLWAECPAGVGSMDLATRLLDEADVVVIPGSGFGPTGEGYVRFALTVPEERTREAVERIAKLGW